MFGFGRITLSEQAIYLRFERVGNPRKFAALMDRFNQSFVWKTWNEQRRAWQFVPGELDAIVEFCLLTFGPLGYTIERDNTTSVQSGQSMFSFAKPIHPGR